MVWRRVIPWPAPAGDLFVQVVVYLAGQARQARAWVSIGGCCGSEKRKAPRFIPTNELIERYHPPTTTTVRTLALSMHLCPAFGSERNEALELLFDRLPFL